MKKIIYICLIIFMLSVINVFAGSNRIMLNNKGIVILLDRSNQFVRSYPSTWSPYNEKVYCDGDKFWVLQRNGWVYVYKVSTGRLVNHYHATSDQTKSHIRNNNTKSWVR